MVITPEISIRYALPFRTFSRGSRLGARTSALGIFVLVMQVVGWLALALLAVIVVVNVAFGHAEVVKPLLPMFIFPVFLIAAPPILRLVSYRNLRGSMPELRMQFEADKFGFRRTIENTGDASWRWDATHAILSNESVVVIAVRKGAFVFIPRQALSDAQLERLKQMLSEAKKAC